MPGPRSYGTIRPAVILRAGRGCHEKGVPIIRSAGLRDGSFGRSRPGYGSTLIKKQGDYTFFKSLFWRSGVVSPHTPAGGLSAFEKLVFASDVFDGELEEFDRELERYHKMLDACGVAKKAQENIFAGTMWRLLNRQKP